MPFRRTYGRRRTSSSFRNTARRGSSTRRRATRRRATRRAAPQTVRIVLEQPAIGQSVETLGMKAAPAPRRGRF
jgi:hypothetical protein